MGKYNKYLLILLLLLLAFTTNAKADYATTLSFGGYVQSGTEYIGTSLVDYWSAPIVNDWNGDGNIDLLVGHKISPDDYGLISYYENTSATNNEPPSFGPSTTILACENACILNVRGAG